MLYNMESLGTGCVPSNSYASANFTPLHFIWFSSGRDGSQAFQANFKPTCKHSGVKLGELFCWHAKSLCCLILELCVWLTPSDVE